MSERPPEPGLEVRWHHDGIPPGLDALADSFFQQTAWLGALRVADPDLRPTVIAASQGGELVAALPMMASRRLGTLRCYAGAWATYGGIVARTPAAAARIRRELEDFVRRPQALLVRIHDFSNSLAALADPRWREWPEQCQVLDLPADPEALFRDAFTPQNRNKIRKAERAGLSVRRANDAPALEAYTALYRQSTERWGVERPRMPRLLAALAGTPGVEVWLAEANGEAVAALLNLSGGRQIMNWGNVSRRESWDLAPNNLLHWRALEAACLDPHGPRLYNFGASPDLPGVAAFKAGFGARPYAYTRREHMPRWVEWGRAWLGRGRGRPHRVAPDSASG